ncbi:MAG: PP2C family protein-serine/threonine phosphatase [Phycisphaerales bacterium]
MLNGTNIIVLAQGDALDHAQHFAKVLRESLPAALRPALEICAIDRFQAEGACEYDAAISLIDDVADELRSVWRQVSSAFDEQRVPFLAIADLSKAAAGEPQRWLPAGSLRIDCNIDPNELCGRIEAVLHQQRIIRGLDTDLQLARRFQGGLRGEISRMHEELQLAAMVQQEMLPRSLPEINGVRFGAIWRPANYVSGDIYDVIRLDETHIGVFIADAVGHGVPAALLTMVIHRAVRTKQVTANGYRIIPPSETLAKLNQEMVRRQGDTTRFATALYAVIDCESRCMTIAGAGHPPPLLLRGDDEPVHLPVSGGLLGVFEHDEFPECSVQLAEDDRVIFFSDGFEVAFPETAQTERGMKMPSDRYLDEFARLAQFSGPDDMIRQLSMRLDSQPGSLHQVDDLTLIAMHIGRDAPSTVKQSAVDRNDSQEDDAPAPLPMHSAGYNLEGEL